LKQTEEDVKIMLVRLAKDREEADEAKKMVAQEEKIAKVAEAEATEIANQVSGEVEAANSELEKTLEKINLLTQGNLNEINSFPNPPSKIKYVMIAVCILLMPPKETGVKSSWSEDEFEGYFWELGKRQLLSNAKVLLDK